MSAIILKLRTAKGWSQEELSELSGVSVRTIQRIEAGESASFDTLKALAAAFNVRYEDIIDTEDKPEDDVAPRVDKILLRAKIEKQIKKKYGFYIHATQYLVVISALAVINYFNSSYPWVLWVAFGWGIGVIFHGVSIFLLFPQQRLEEAVTREMKRQKSLD